jgi:hypothetical protein
MGCITRCDGLDHAVPCSHYIARRLASALFIASQFVAPEELVLRYPARVCVRVCVCVCVCALVRACACVRERMCAYKRARARARASMRVRVRCLLRIQSIVC